MSTTTILNPNGKENDKKKKVAVAAAGAAAVAGVAAAVASGHDDAEEPILEPTDLAIEENPEAETEMAEGDANAESSTAVSGAASPSPTVTVAVEPQAATEDFAENTELTIDPEFEDLTTEVTEEISGVDTAQVDPSEPAAVEMENSGDVADTVIAEEHIDPNDIDMENVVNFDEIGTVYTYDGESHTAATFHDDAGNNLVMVDTDGDNVFDIITDTLGHLIAEMPGNLSVGDAQEDIVDTGEYMAYDETTDNADEFGSDSLSDDILA